MCKAFTPPTPPNPQPLPPELIAITATLIYIGSGELVDDRKFVDEPVDDNRDVATLPVLDGKDIKRLLRDSEGRVTSIYRTDRRLPDTFIRHDNGGNFHLLRTDLKRAATLAALDDDSAELVLRELLRLKPPGKLFFTFTGSVISQSGSDWKPTPFQYTWNRPFGGGRANVGGGVNIGAGISSTKGDEHIPLLITFWHHGFEGCETIDNAFLPLLNKREFTVPHVYATNGATILFAGRATGDSEMIEEPISPMPAIAKKAEVTQLLKDLASKDGDKRFEYFLLLRAERQ